MSELSGLANIINSAGTLHALREAPKRGHFESNQEFEAAFSAWWVDMNCWKATFVEQVGRVPVVGENWAAIVIPEPRTNRAILADKAWMYGCMAVYVGYQLARQMTCWLVWALDR